MININMGRTKKTIILALLTAQALVLSIVENWIPLPVVLPGIKLGLANIVVLITIVFFGLKDALVIVLVRTVLSSFFSGGFTVFMFSISGGILSSLVMNFLYKKMFKVFSIMGISIAGAIMHNLGQLLMASLIMKDFSVMMYLPILFLSAVIMGSFTGLCSNYLIKALKKTRIF
jgi:heptaprenyl diphosphate synthase